MNQALETITRTPAPVAVSDATLNLFQDSVALNTRRAYAAALRRLDAWLDGQQLTDATLADYLGQLDTQGRAPSTANAVCCRRPVPIQTGRSTDARRSTHRTRTPGIPPPRPHRTGSGPVRRAHL